jgi:hypothetical protein
MLHAAPRRSLQFAKADSTATLSQQEKSNSADVQRDGFILSRRYTWPIASRRARHRRRMFESYLRFLRLQQKSRCGPPVALWRHA